LLSELGLIAHCSAVRTFASGWMVAKREAIPSMSNVGIVVPPRPLARATQTARPNCTEPSAKPQPMSRWRKINYRS